ncbi:ABC transporter permease [Pseudooceanicola lipolyticus]|uniref:ABC transporter permease n=1 Tax=Pseudooceanicola lipolyticus TaxID=2029104 RepID=A0A2M8J790_9RHOB|nr:ABC transporter permease [Pseudooceanicola lipolyticus]PJE38648.1 ABC transporter permease [Pseudooceanicola lipolyticus]
MIEQVLAAGFILTTPILLAAIGGLVNRQAGIVNIALEGKMLIGAFVAVLVSSATGSWLVATVSAALVGMVIGYAFSLSITRLGANMIIAGLGLNVLAAGAIGFIMSIAYGSSGTLRLPDVALLPNVLPESIVAVPLVGPMLADLDPLTLFAVGSIAVLPFFLGATRFGLWIRATGNASSVVRSVGLNPKLVQEAATAFAGFFAGIAGAQLALASIGIFNEGLTAGRGFIALAAFYFGRDRPWQTAAACLLFGLLDAAQIRMQTVGLPPRLIGALPYLMVLVALVITQLRSLKRTQ